MKKQNDHVTCRVLSPYEVRRFEYYMKDRNFDSRSMYFGMAVTNDGIRDLVDHMVADPENHKVVVAEDDQLEIVGTIHIAVVSDTEVELGIMVSEAYRGQHVASKMMDFVLNWCRNRNYTGLYMHCLSYNAPVLHVVKKYGLEITNMYGDSEAHIQLPRANIFTLGRESLATQQSILKQNVMSFKKMLHLQ